MFRKFIVLSSETCKVSYVIVLSYNNNNSNTHNVVSANMLPSCCCKLFNNAKP